MFLTVSSCVKLLSTIGLSYVLYHTFANKSRRKPYIDTRRLVIPSLRSLHPQLVAVYHQHEVLYRRSQARYSVASLLTSATCCGISPTRSVAYHQVAGTLFYTRFAQCHARLRRGSIQRARRVDSIPSLRLG